MRVCLLKVHFVHFVHVVHGMRWAEWTKWTRRLRAAAVLIVLAAMARAQQPPSPGSLRITVLDPNGQTVSSAIILAQQNGKTVAQDRTTPTGEALLNRLAPGAYTVLVEK